LWFSEAHNFRYGRPLCFLAPGANKPSCATANKCCRVTVYGGGLCSSERPVAKEKPTRCHNPAAYNLIRSTGNSEEQETHSSAVSTEIIMYSGSVQLGIAQSQVIFISGDPVAVILDRSSVEQSISLKGMLCHARIYNLYHSSNRAIKLRRIKLCRCVADLV
jgi:hypothetical protein